MSRKLMSLGDRGEELAAGFLRDNGYKIISRKYKVKLGEIDIVALDKDVLCFVEVKARRSIKFGSGKEAVFGRKQRQISKVALNFLKENSCLNKKSRFDVVSVDFSSIKPRLDLVKDAFELSGEFTY